jgi:hypothetical protein
MPPKFMKAYPMNISYPNGANGAPCLPLKTSSYLKLPTTSIFNLAARYDKLSA